MMVPSALDLRRGTALGAIRGARRSSSKVLLVALASIALIAPMPWNSLQTVLRDTPLSPPIASQSDGKVCVQPVELRSNKCLPAQTQAGAAAQSASAWLSLAPRESPPSGILWPSLAYDPAENETLLVAGYEYPSFSAFNQTWVFTGDVWSNQTATVGPEPGSRMYSNLVYDPAANQTILIGGCSIVNGPKVGPFCAGAWNQTWAFASGKWTFLGNATPLNQQSGDHCTWSATYDPEIEAIIVQACNFYGNSSSGTTWIVDGGNWTDASYNLTGGVTQPAPSNAGPVLVGDPAADGVLLFGGTLNYAMPPGGKFGASNYTWLYSNGYWTNVSSESNVSPPATNENQAAGVYDPDIGAVLIYDQGGTWEWKNGTWTNVSSGTSPGNLTGFEMTWDSQLNGALMYGAARGNVTWLWTSTPPITELNVSASSSIVDPNVRVYFSEKITGGTPPYSYAWAFGDGETSIDSAPEHAYSSPGIYHVTLALSDAAGHERNASLNVSVVAPTQVAPYASPNPTEVGYLTTFHASAVGNESQYANFTWEFGDNLGFSNGSNLSRASGMTVTHTFLSPGNYTIALIWSDTGGPSHTSEFSVLVLASLNVSITASPTTPVLGQLVNFSALVTGGEAPFEFAWNFGDGGTGGNLEQISHVFTTDGPFEVNVTARDELGIVREFSMNMSIALNLSIAGRWDLGAAPLDESFASRVTGGTPGYSYLWRFGDGGTSTQADPTYVYSIPGLYLATLIVNDRSGQGAVSSWTIMVSRGGGPLSVTLNTSETVVSPGSSTAVTAQVYGGQGGYSLNWSKRGVGQCSPSAMLSEICTGASAGPLIVSLNVTDQVASVATGSVTILFGNSEPGSKSPPSTPPPLANRDPFDSIIAVAGVVFLSGIGAAAVVRIRRKPPQRLDSIPEYRALSPVPNPAPELGGAILQEPEEFTDPLGDLV
jgi:PKD repeat protein